MTQLTSQTTAPSRQLSVASATRRATSQGLVRSKGKGKRTPTQHTQKIEEEGKESESYELLTLSQRRNAPITVSLRVNQVEMAMEVDTGASVSIVSEATYRKLWPGGKFPLQPSDAKLRSYTGENCAL